MLGNKGQRDQAAQLESGARRRPQADRRAGARARGPRPCVDPVTDLLAFPAFERRLDEEVERSRRHGRALAVAIVDVDGFRIVNARHGRHVGDDVLKTVASILENFTRATDRDHPRQRATSSW